MSKPKLIVMLTHDDVTVKNADEIFERCKNSEAEYWGFKEKGLSFDKMKMLFQKMKKCGKTTGLEVVAYTEQESLAGAKMALKCGCDILMGTIYFDSINTFCKNNNLKYMPFVGTVTDRPSVLNGSIDDMVSEAKSYIDKGVYGIDLLGYRYTGDTVLLNKRLISEIKAPVCIAGSVNNFERLDEIIEADADFFTIGSAFFENKFGEDFCEQINTVCDYINGKKPC